MIRIAVFVATRWELLALRRTRLFTQASTIGGIRCLAAGRADRVYYVVQTGIGPQRARDVAQRLLGEGTWACALSVGFAAALVPADIGDLIIGTDIVSVSSDGRRIQGQEAFRCSQDEHGRLSRAGRDIGVPVKTGRIVSSSRIICRAEEKRLLHQLTDATGLDMESAAIAAVAQARNIPMAVARTVSDLLEEDLPLDFNLFLRPTGWIPGLWALLSGPGNFASVNRLRRQSRVAGDRLADFFRQYVETCHTAES